MFHTGQVQHTKYGVLDTLYFYSEVLYILQLQKNLNYLTSGNSTLRVKMLALFAETSTRSQDFWVVKSGLTPVEMLLEILHYSLWLQMKNLDLILAQFLQCQIFQL